MATIPPGGFYHVYNRGNNRENLFCERRNYHHVLRLYVRYVEPVAATYAYCLLPNHFHLLIRVRTETEHACQDEPGPPPDPPDPSWAFANLFNAHTKAINHAYGRTGKLFEGRFRRKPVDNRRYFATLVRYIHQNPQHHGLVDDFRDWPFTSYVAILSERPARVRRETVLAWFDGRAAFVEAHQVPAAESVIDEILFG